MEVEGFFYEGEESSKTKRSEGDEGSAIQEFDAPEEVEKRNDTENRGWLYYGFDDKEIECLFKPKCLENYKDNEAAVMRAWENLKRVAQQSTTFPCWKTGKNSFHLRKEFSMIYGYLGIFVPLAVFFLCLAGGIKFGSSGWRSFLCYPIRRMRGLKQLI